ncbi:MAG: hypothetical protein BKP49_09605 [Treponema sp. CETP13]|nr:MAG: hypothetical protein BKP49_09605 [Treponema sp. CETP13]
MKKLYLSWGFGCLCIVLCLFEFMTLMHIPGMQKGFTLKITTDNVFAVNVQNNTPVWKAGLRDGDVLKKLNGYSDVQLQRLRHKGSVSGFVGKRNKIFTVDNGVTLELENGKIISVPYSKQSFLNVLKTIPLWNVSGYLFALLILISGFFICYKIYCYNMNVPQNRAKKYIRAIILYLLAIIVASYRIPFCSNDFYSKFAVITFDLATIGFSIIILDIVSKIIARNSIPRKFIKTILIIFIITIFILKYILLLLGFIQYDTFPYAFFYIISYAITGCFSVSIIVYCYIHSGLIYSEIGEWVQPGKAIEIDFDSLEKTLLSKKTVKDIFDYVNVWIMQNFGASFSAYVAIDSKGKINNTYYKEQETVNKFFLDMLKERMGMVENLNTKIHKNGGISVKLTNGNETLGFLFIGSARKTYNAGQLKILGPLVRILLKAFEQIEVEEAKQQKNRLQFAFSRYISPELVNNILQSPTKIDVGGEKKNLSVVFTDIQGFTDLSEELDPDILLKVINSYLTEMSEVIIALGGTIDKFEGDAILAFFGAPNPLSDHAVRCCKAALGMQKMEKIINEQLLHEGLIKKPLHTRMGINTGEMIVGNVGSIKRLDYTIIGGNVNIASRLETANKDFGTQILITENTWNIVKDTFEARRIDKVNLKGIHHPVVVYELLGERANSEIPLKTQEVDSLIPEIVTLEEI